MRVLDDHIERQAHEYQGGNGRECFICHGPYYITPGLEDICGVCLDCAQEAVRDALRYRYLRAGHQGCYNRVMIHALTALDDAVDEAIDARTANPVPEERTS